MGAYINPTGQDKEAWLVEHGDEKTLNGFEYPTDPSVRLPVILVDNGAFTAAGIAYDEREFNAFTDAGDGRSKRYFYVDVDKLHGVSNLADYTAPETA